MGFWIFILIMALLIPVIKLGFGSYFAKKAPREINHFVGYRTSMSMKNRDTWEFAHHHCGRLWRVIGGIMLVVSAAIMVPVMGKDETFVGLYGTILCLIQTVVLIASIFITEKAMKRQFDESGRPRELK